MRGTFRILFFTLVSALSFLVDAAHAEETDPAAAEALFQKGRGAMAEEDFDEACKLFEESFALDPAVGTVMNLAVCEEKRGHLAMSWERWHQALDLLEEGDDRVGYAMIRLESIESRLAYLTIVPAEGAPAGLAVKRDDVPLGSASLGVELPADPGKHIVIVETEQHKPKRYTVTLEQGEHRDLVVTAGPPKPAPKSQSAGRKVRLSLGITALGVGVAGAGLAIATGAMLPGQDKTIQEHCPDKRCDSTGSSAIDRARTLLVLNTVGFVAAGVGLASGAALLLTLPGKEKAAGRPETAMRDAASPDPSRGHTLGIALNGPGISVFGDF